MPTARYNAVAQHDSDDDEATPPGYTESGVMLPRTDADSPGLQDPEQPLQVAKGKPVPGPSNVPSTMTIGSNLPYLALDEQAFTPLSMESSEFALESQSQSQTKNQQQDALQPTPSRTKSRSARRPPSPPQKSPGALEAERLVRTAKSLERLRTARSMERLRRQANASAASSSKESNSSANAAGRGTSPAPGTQIHVEEVVQSFEKLHKAAVSDAEKLVRSKSQGHRERPPVPPVPSTLSLNLGSKQEQDERGEGQRTQDPDESATADAGPAAASADQQLQSTAGEGSHQGATPLLTGGISNSSGSDNAVGARAADDNHENENDFRSREAVPRASNAALPDPSKDTSATANGDRYSKLLSSEEPDPVPQTIIAQTTLIRPTPSAPQSPVRTRTRDRAPSSPKATRPPLVRTASTASVTLSHPVPDSNKLSQAGGFLGNIAALEATAERLASCGDSTLEDAIREEHNELKRSESRRSRASTYRRTRGESMSEDQQQVGTGVGVSRQSSVRSTHAVTRSNMAASGYMMSPKRLRSGSKASSTGFSGQIPETEITTGAGQENEDGSHPPPARSSFLSRHGPGKASVRSVASSRISLTQIAELEPPSAITQEALDAADRAAATGQHDDDDDEDVLRARAHQYIEDEFAEMLKDVPDQPLGVSLGLSDFSLPPPATSSAPTQIPGAETGGLNFQEYRDEPFPRLQLHQPDNYQPYGASQPLEHHLRPATTASTYDPEAAAAQAAFDDFDGVHCDPDAPDPRHSLPPSSAEHGSARPLPTYTAYGPAPPRPQPRFGSQQRPTSYIDPITGQQMIYYPAPVPAMLNLPPKLSKKPKAAQRNARRSQIVSHMPRAARESRTWLPDPTEGLRETSDFSMDVLGRESEEGPVRMSGDGQTQSDGPGVRHSVSFSVDSTGQQPSCHGPRQEQPVPGPVPGVEPQNLRVPQSLKENRKSSINPHLRASAFFDLPSTTLPKLEVKNGSAMDTLDSILDASATAPVNAFTDHVFAGKLGAEVYGPEKRKKRVKKSTTGQTQEDKKDDEAKDKDSDEKKPKKLVKRNSAGNLLDPNQAQEKDKKRASRFSLFTHKRSPSSSSTSPSDDEDTHPHPQKQDSESEYTTETEEEPEPIYQGPPTTLLAELQIRKQQVKNRTRLPAHARTNGMHTTLLELDAVAEMERKARLGKRVTLAWEDPAASKQDEESDEDVPLGMLYAAKVAGGAKRSSTMDISILMSEVSRPLGLMEKRELEDNEPLSRRRERLLAGKDPSPAANQGLSLEMLQKRLTLVPGAAPTGLQLRRESRLAIPGQGASSGSNPRTSLSRPGSRAQSLVGVAGVAPVGLGVKESEESEHEEETLAARKERLKKANLPEPRPVSGAFSAEVLSQFAPEDKGEKEKDPPAHSRNVSSVSATAAAQPQTQDVPEEEETLAQRRARLQREREMAGAGGNLPRSTTPLPSLNLNLPVPSLNLPTNTNNRHTLAPGAIPASSGGLSTFLTRPPSAFVMNDPREAERLRKEADAARYQREQAAKLAALRAQMPQSLTTPTIGARSGGFMGGMFNDGFAGAGSVGSINGRPVTSYYGTSAGGGMTLLQQREMLDYQQQQQQQFRPGTGTLLGQIHPQQGIGMNMGYAGGMGLQSGFGASTPNLAMGTGMGIGGAGHAGNVGGGGLVGGTLGMPGTGTYGGMMVQPHGTEMVERWRQSVLP